MRGITKEQGVDMNDQRAHELDEEYDMNRKKRERAEECAQDAHVCKESRACVCCLSATEPDEGCPVHGGGDWPPRCAVCGRFMKQKQEANEKEK